MTLTPVGDYLARRYPPNPGATHWMGNGDDPGCCAGAHPSCLYDVAWREALRSVAVDLDERATRLLETSTTVLDRAVTPGLAECYRDAARMARKKAEEAP